MFQSEIISRIKSPVFDEPPHIAAGLSYLHSRSFNANPEHPPLLKELCAMSLLLGGVRLPKSDEAAEMEESGEGLEWDLGSRIIAWNGAVRTMFWARLPFILLAGLLGLAIYLWGRRLVGETAAFAALFLYLVDPTITAHSFIAGTDLGLAAFTIFFLMGFWNYLIRPSWPLMLISGALLGLALVTKFSAVLLLPIAGLLMFAALLARRGPATESPLPRRLLAGALSFLAICAVAAVVIEVVYLFSRDPWLYVEGFRQVKAMRADYQTYIAGHLRDHFAGYFAVAYLVKEPIAVILLLGTGLVVLLRDRSTTLLSRLFLLLPPAVFFVAYSFKAAAIGVRYLLPVFPFAFLIAGLGLTMLFRSRFVVARSVAMVLCVWLLIATIGIYPDHLAYFNEAACLLHDPSQIGFDGGSRCGTAWLDDSNVDWGQGLLQARSWLDRNAPGRTAGLVYFGTVNPRIYGLPVQVLDGAAFSSKLLPSPLIIVSGHFVARAPRLLDQLSEQADSWIKDATPQAIIGHSLYVYGSW
jgi:hypothetical protein